MAGLQDAKALQVRANGWSLLHLAAGLGQAASVELLIKHGADIHGRRFYAFIGKPALHLQSLPQNFIA